MKLSEIGPNFRAIKDIVAFKWVKPKDKIKSDFIFIPDTVKEAPYEYSDQRLGNKYTCQAISCGPECTEIKPGDFFILHEFNSIGQEGKWQEDNVFFCYEKNITATIPEGADLTTFASPITEDMEKHFAAEDGEVEVNIKYD
jgi:hypothetical protein